MLRSIICPATLEDEEVDGIETPLGFLITRCTRVASARQLKCTRACAVQISPPRANREDGDGETTLRLARPSRPAFADDEGEEPEWAPYPISLVDDSEVVASAPAPPADDAAAAEPEWAPYPVGH